MTGRAAAAAAAAVLAGAACAPETGPLMAPGEDCLGCHDGGAARAWTAAGTFPGRGRTVELTDANGFRVTLTTNQVGNFYTAEPLAFPIHPSVDGIAMPVAATYGGCNRCHANGANAGGSTLQTGPLMLPGQDCLSCHDGRTAILWTAAGTWLGPGNTVVITDSAGKSVTLTTNEVGNFYTAEPFQLPLYPKVNGTAMLGGTTYGGCAKCHGTGGANG